MGRKNQILEIEFGTVEKKCIRTFKKYKLFGIVFEKTIIFIDLILVCFNFFMFFGVFVVSENSDSSFMNVLSEII